MIKWSSKPINIVFFHVNARNLIRNQCHRVIAYTTLAEFAYDCCANTPMRFTRTICPKMIKHNRRNAAQTLIMIQSKLNLVSEFMLILEVF